LSLYWIAGILFGNDCWYNHSWSYDCRDRWSHNISSVCLRG